LQGCIEHGPQRERGLAPTTVSLGLAAATSLLDLLALPTPRVPRVEVDPAPAVNP
jgi:hypothetical protein